MPSYNLLKSERYSFSLYLSLGESLTGNEEWEFKPFTAEVRNDYLGVFGAMPARQVYLLPLTPVVKDPDYDWDVELLPSYLQYQTDQSGMRGIQVGLVEYDISPPSENWEEEYGNFVSWYRDLAHYFVPAVADDLTVVPTSRVPVLFSSKPYAATSTIYIAVLASQDSPRPLNLVNGEIELLFSRKKKAGR